MPVRGDKQVAAALRALTKAVDAPMNAAARFALRPTLSAAKRNLRSLDLSDSSGALQESLTVKRNERLSRKLKPVHQVGPDSGKTKSHISNFTGEKVTRKPVKYAHLLEFGTAPHFIREGVMHPGAAPKPFMTPAYLETKEIVAQRFTSRFVPEIEKRAARHAARRAAKK